MEYQEYYVFPSSMHELAQHFSLGECARIDTGSLGHVDESDICVLHNMTSVLTVLK